MNTLCQFLLNELETEAVATRKCIERVPESLFEYVPHEKSMKMGYLCVMMADMPHWISTGLEVGEIDFATYEQWYPKTTAEVLEHFDRKMAHAREVLNAAKDEDLHKPFVLKNSGQVLMSTTNDLNISSTINHWVHHRGQLTVYMRLNNIAVPSIYGPSADEKMF